MKENKLPFEIEKYLNKFSSDNRKLENRPDNTFNIIVVIPALEEYEGIKKLLLSLSENDTKYLRQLLFIFVINNTTTVTAAAKFNNSQSLELLPQRLRLLYC